MVMIAPYLPTPHSAYPPLHIEVYPRAHFEGIRPSEDSIMPYSNPRDSMYPTPSCTSKPIVHTHLERVRPSDGDDDALPHVVDDDAVRCLVQAVVEVRQH